MSLPIYGPLAALVLFVTGLAMAVLWRHGHGEDIYPRWATIVCWAVVAGAVFAFAGLASSEWVRQEARRAPSGATLRKLWGSWWGRHDVYVQNALATNAATPPDVLARLATLYRDDPITPSGLRAVGMRPTATALASNPSLPASALSELASSPNPVIRRLVLPLRSMLPQAEQRKLACDSDSIIHMAIGEQCADRTLGR